MRVLCVIDILVYKTFLTKLFIAAGVTYECIAPEEDTLARRLAAFRPDAVLIQDSYHAVKSADLAAFIRKSATQCGLSARILVLDASTGRGVADFDASRFDPDVLRVTRESFGQEIARLSAEAKVRENEEKIVLGPTRQRDILLVDAGKTLVHVVRAALKFKNCAVTQAHDADEALAACARGGIELVLTSVQLPGLSGLELCRRLKEDNTGAYLPVIVLSSSDDPLDVDTAFNCGADDYLVKSFSPMMLAEKVGDHLDLIERRRHNKILVVDDSKLTREILRHSFHKSGLNVLTARDGREALELARGERPDVVVTDIEMPVMDGYELCRRLRDDEELKNILVVIMSGRGRVSDIKKAERLGVSRYFVKPFDVDKVQLVVEQLLAESYRNYKKEYEHVLASMGALITALEARDEYTKGHTARVSRMALRLGRFMGLVEETLRELEIGATLHDIGKIGVRDAVLLKPGKLTDEEYARIQEHAIIGAEILRPISSLRGVIPLIMLHHERWDGQGYPSALAGEAIPLGARIIAIADAYDAMTSDRPYRAGMGVAKALEVIEMESGRQFCPECARAFLDMMAGVGANNAVEAGDAA